jgi:hypothetical protein
MAQVQTHIYYEIKHGDSTMVIAGKHNYSTFGDAIAAVKAFKLNPKLDTPSMSDENVEYWKNEKYTIEHHIHTVVVQEVI